MYICLILDQNQMFNQANNKNDITKEVFLFNQKTIALKSNIIKVLQVFV